jgi:protocatechuate 3,4-dioxygenase beta subunit
MSLGNVTLAAGQRETLRVTLPAGPIASKASTAPPLGLLLAGVAADSLDGVEVVIWSADGVDAAPESTIGSVSGGVAVQVPGGCRAGVHVLVKTEDGIAAVGPVEPVAGACGTTLRSTLRPLGDLRATLLAPRPADGERLPDRGLLRLADCPTGARPGSGVEPLEQLEVPVRLLPPGEGQPQRPQRALLEAPLPADCGWAALSVGQFAPVEVPAPERAEPGVRVDLGRVELRHGGAILARVVGSDGVALDGARLDAWPHEDGGDTGLHRPGAEPSARRIASGVTDEQGWVRLYGLPPGAVELLVSPKDREVPHRAPHVVVGAREEVLVDPLEVPPISSLTLKLVGMSRLSSDGLLPRHVTLSWRGGSSPPSVQQLSRTLHDEPDKIVIDEIPSGRWAVTGFAWMDGVGSQLRPVAESEVVIAPGDRIQADLDFDHLVFEGRITLRGEPVSGSASFMPVPWDDRRGMTVSLDEDGEFRIPLERAGAYTLQVMSREKEISGALIPEAVFEDPDVQYEFPLDEGRIGGRVRTGWGETVPGVWIDLVAFRNMATSAAGVSSLRRRVRTDEAGAFELDAVSPGLWTIRVDHENGASVSRTLRLDPKEWRLGLDLILEDRSVEGWVRDPSGAAVVGAAGVLIFEPSHAGAFATVRAFETDLEGRYEVPGESPWRATIQVRSPGGVWHAGRLSSGAPVFELPPTSGGQLEVSMDGTSAAWRTRGLWIVHEASGGYLDLFKAGRTITTAEGRLAGHRVSNLASGRWRLVTTPDLVSLDALYRGFGARLQPLAEMVVTEGSTATVDLEADLSTDFESEEER